MRPSGPVPTTKLKSMPFSAARVFANGLATIRSPDAAGTAAVPPDGVVATVGATVVADAAAAAPTLGPAFAPAAATLSMSSLFVARSPTGAPTRALSPSGVRMAARYPSSYDSTSISALSDSTTSNMSPTSTLSPMSTSQLEIFPSVIVDDSAGIMIWAISTSTASAETVPSDAAAAVGTTPAAAAPAISASVSTRIATGAPTSALSPSGTRIFAIYPSSYASTSISALSDSTTSTMSPTSTLSPSDLSHCEILPSVIVDDRAGIMISAAI
mmetsp:Transcript_24261/g.55185  ORF Transcript_24261/g.55185 Transcript_24261/m.55185 type:complete len:271 (+) Transcript_24261:1372-2184(+)